MDEADIRYEAFIDDIVAVCKKHRVLLSVDDRYDSDPVEFAEYPVPGGDGYGFIIGSRVLEDAVRNAVWSVIHPSA